MENEDPTTQRRALGRTLKIAWALFWLAFIGNFVAWRAIGDGVLMLGFYTVVAFDLWLAFTTARAATSAGYAGLLWGIGVIAAGPLGAFFLPWIALIKLRSAK